MKYLLLIPILALGSSFAAEPSNEDEISRRAQSEGSLIAMAQFCGTSNDQVRSLASKLEQATLLAAKGQPFAFDSAVYRQHAIAGIKTTQKTLAYVPSSGPGYESNCKEVHAKVSAALAR
jgi:hypothetical protein